MSNNANAYADFLAEKKAFLDTVQAHVAKIKPAGVWLAVSPVAIDEDGRRFVTVRVGDEVASVRAGRCMQGDLDALTGRVHTYSRKLAAENLAAAVRVDTAAPVSSDHQGYPTSRNGRGSGLN